MMWLWVALPFISGDLLTVTVIKVKPNRKGEKDMNKVKKRILTVLLALSAVILVALLVFFGVYFTRIQTIGSIEQLTDYEDGYNLYRMDIKYDYSLDDIID